MGVSARRKRRQQNTGASFRVAEHVVVPKANDPIALAFDHRRARRIGFFRMLAAVHLDHELRPMARKIDDEMTDGDLPAPAGPGGYRSQQPPHRAFGIGHLPPKPTSARDGERWRNFLHAQCVTAGSPPSKLR